MKEEQRCYVLHSKRTRNLARARFVARVVNHSAFPFRYVVNRVDSM